ncbi:DUF3052 domain-containing protein [Corynebacterium breve]|uniref:DUF3052 domain-containing protein n=1 Tax=Corynebacterium breve TaxID=3049799 RepID=A0ABY8VD58_9CORY|nr:DUF3052 domain-containing protein [Corynebacterium breve]WIM67042.1 DUF3052 domain-containing protein [Corynebacterium breve]
MGATGVEDYAKQLGIEGDHIVQELGWDEDADSSISEAIEDAIGDSLLDEDTDELCDVVLLWYRAEDGDLVDSLMDAARNLDEEGRIWLLTPAANKPGSVNPGEISESAQLAGLVQTKADRIGTWQGSCLEAGGR